LSYILSADIGGTKIATALSHVRSPQQLLYRDEFLSIQQGDELFNRLIHSFQRLSQQAAIEEIDTVSIAIPGIIDREQGVVQYQANLPWRNFPLKQKLEEYFPFARIDIDGDVVTAALGEYKARQFSKQTLIYVTLSTGISCATISNGQIIRGAGMSGEIGFSMTEQHGFLEHLAAGPGLTQMLNQHLEKSHTLKEWMTVYYEGDEQVQQLIHYALKQFAKTVHTLMMALDPHVVVLGGGVFNNHPLLVEKVNEFVDSYYTLPIFEGKKRRIEPSLNKENAGLIGAAYK